MNPLRCLSDESEGDTASNGKPIRLIDDPDNYAKELPVRNSRNPKPQYKILTAHQPIMPRITRSRAKATPPRGRGTNPMRKITPRRKEVISRFLMECSTNPGKYGRVGCLNWYSELTNKINTPEDGRNLNLGEPVSNADVQNWVDQPDFAEAYENLKANESQQEQPVPGTSGGLAKDKVHLSSLRPKKRLRPNPSVNLDPTVAIPSSRSKNTKGLLPRSTSIVINNKTSGDEDTSSSGTEKYADQEPVPLVPVNPTVTMSQPANSAMISPGPITIIKRNLTEDELSVQAASFADQIVMSSVGYVKQEIIEQSEIIGSLEDEIGIGEVEQEPGISQADRNQENQNVGRQYQGSVVPPDREPTDIDTLVPYESLGVRVHQKLQADHDRGLIQASEDNDMSTAEEARATTQVLTSLHNSIDGVRLNFIHLTNLHFHKRAPVAMSVLGFIVDSLISFVANYLDPDDPVK